MTNGNIQLTTRKCARCSKEPKEYPVKLSPKKALAAIWFLFFLVFAPVFAEDLQSESYPATVTDISDRAYEKAIIELLDNAKSSIVMSMYMLKPAEAGPVRLLVRDLEEALERGVRVEIYLNIRPDHGMPPSDIMIQPLQSLIKKGAKIYKFTPHTRLHDKLIIVDERFVVEGSMNWSVAAIKSNYESAVLIDSPGLAKVKLIRLRNFPLEGDKKEEKPRPDRPTGLKPLPEGAIVGASRELLTNTQYFAAMLKKQANRTMDMYLLLLAESARTNEKEFFVSLEDMAVALGMDPACDDTALRRQMIKELEALEGRYKLIDVDFRYGKDAWVELRNLPGETFNVGGAFFDPANLVCKSQPAKFVILMKALLESEGSLLEQIPVRDLASRFGVSQFSIRKGLRKAQGK